MSSTESPSGPFPNDPRPKPGIEGWIRRVVFALVALLVVWLLWRASAAFFPRWWAQRVAGQVDSSLIWGVTWGLFYGFIFTVVPLLIVWQLRRKFFSWPWRIAGLVLAVLLAAPNWLTLSIVAGVSKSAHAGERILDVEAPGFRAGTLFGVIAAALVMLAVIWTGARLRRRSATVAELKSELRDNDRKVDGD